MKISKAKIIIYSLSFFLSINFFIEKVVFANSSSLSENKILQSAENENSQNEISYVTFDIKNHLEKLSLYNCTVKAVNFENDNSIKIAAEFNAENADGFFSLFDGEIKTLNFTVNALSPDIINAEYTVPKEFEVNKNKTVSVKNTGKKIFKLFKSENIEFKKEVSKMKTENQVKTKLEESREVFLICIIRNQNGRNEVYLKDKDSIFKIPVENYEFYETGKIVYENTNYLIRNIQK